MIRVVLADDHTLVREGIRTLLGLVEGIELVGEASDGEEAVRVVERANPDLLVLDMRMPKGDGLFVVKTLAAKEALPPTLILTTFDDEEAALDVVKAGARGFLLKDVTLERLVEAVRTIAGGGTMIRPGLSERAERGIVARKEVPPAIENDALTNREREVLRLLANGYSNREIAKALFVAEGTIKNHVSNILTKLDVRDRTRAVLKAVERGYV